MLKHTLKTIFRQLWRSPLFTGIHLLGLTIGLCCVLIIFLYARHELSYDTTYEHSEDIYRLVQVSEGQGEIDYSAGTPYPLPAALRSEIPDLEVVSGLHFQGSGVIRVPGQDYQRIDNALFVDEGFLEIFNYDFSEAVAPDIMAQPGQAVISSSLAKRLFGADDPVGKEMELEGEYKLTIAAVYEDQERANLQPELLVSLATLPENLHGFDRSSWGVSIGGVTYVKLTAGQYPQQFERSLAGFVDKYINGEEEGLQHRLELQPVADIHFDPRFGDYTSVAVIKPTYLWVAGGIGLLILLMACFNFVNLSLAQNLAKSQTVGMRKVLGANGLQLWGQSWGEALVLAALAGVASLCLLQWALPNVEHVLQRNIYYEGLGDSAVWGFVALNLLFISLVAGGYPAWVIARKEPKEVLGSSKLVSNKDQGKLRQAMVLAQFVITLIMICSALTVSRQLEFLKNKDLGFRQEAIVQVAMGQPGLDAELKQDWSRHTGVEGVSFSLGAPTSNNRLNTSYYPKGKDPKTATERVGIKPVDEDYATTYDLELLAGRFISAADAKLMEDKMEEAGEEWPIVVNERLIKDLGYSQAAEALGQHIVISVNDAQGKIVGVVRDFHTHSLHEQVQAMVMAPVAGLYYEVGVKINPAQVSSTLAYLEKSWKTHYPDNYFNYSFLDESLAEQYLNEERTGSLLQGFAGLAVFIACLGLFGLTAIMVRQRRREIGLRKVLGASVANLWGLLSKDMARLIALAIVIAAPLGWWAMNGWLDNFAYRVNINVWTFVIGGLLLLFIALLTVSGQALRAALANPIEALRNE